MLVCKQLGCVWPDVIAGYSKWFTVNTSGIILLIKGLCKHVFFVVYVLYFCLPVCATFSPLVQSQLFSVAAP